MRIVVKIGTSTLAHSSGHLNIRRVEQLCKVMSDIKNAGHEVILVSSGAIGMGVGKLGLLQRPQDIPTKQAAAAVGQCELMYIYDKLFSEYHHTVAQLLITNDNMVHETRHRNFTNTLNRLLELGALPIINENDTVATEEIVIGDNDTLAAKVAPVCIEDAELGLRRITSFCLEVVDNLAKVICVHRQTHLLAIWSKFVFSQGSKSFQHRNRSHLRLLHR